MNARSANILMWAIRICCLIILLLPLFVFHSTLYPFVFPRIIAFEALIVGVIFLTGILLFNKSQNLTSPFKHSIIYSYAIFLALLTISGIFGFDPERSFWSTHERMTGIIFLWFFFLWLVALLMFFQTKKQFRLLFIVSIIISCIVGVLGLIEGFKLDSFFSGEPFIIRSTLGNPLYVGVYALLHIFLSLYLGLTEEKNRALRLFYYLCAGFNFFILFISAARGPLLALLLCIAVFLFFLIRTRWQWFRTKIYFFAISVVIGLAFLGMLLYSPTGQEWGKKVLPYTLTKAFYYSYDGFYERLALWRIGIEGFMERPFFGWGWENFDRVYELHYRPVVGEGRLRDPWINRSHSQYIDILSLGGIFAFIAYALLWFFTFRFCANKISQTSDREKYASTALFLFFFAYFVQNISGFDTFSSLIVYIPVLAFLIFITKGEKVHSINLQWRRKFILGSFLIITSVSAALFVIAKPFEKSYYADKGLDAVYAYQFEKGARLLRRVFDEHIFFEREVRYLLANYLVRAVAVGALTPEHNNAISYFTAIFDKGLRENSDRYRDNVVIASLYKFLAERDIAYLNKGISYGEKARSIAPRHQVAYHELADLYALAGDLDKAYAMAERAVNLDPKNSYSHFVLSFQALKKGDFDIAFKELQIAQDFKYPVYQEISYVSVLVSKLPKGKEYPQAISFIDRAVESSPSDMNYILAQIVLYYKAGRQKEAIRLYSVLYPKLSESEAKNIRAYLITVIPSFSL